MAMTDIMTGLTTGHDRRACRRPPLAAQLFQWYRQTPYMLDIGLAPVVGATSSPRRRRGTAIPAADRPKLLEAAGGVEKRLQADVPKQDQARGRRLDEARRRR